MSLIAIKIGEGHQPTSKNWTRTSRHLDIIEVMPRNKEAMGRTFGTLGDKHFLAINVDMSNLTDEEFSQVIFLLKESWAEITGYKKEGIAETTIIYKRLRYLDLSNASFLGLNNTIKLNKIEENKSKKRNLQDFDMREVSDYHTVISFENFAKAVKNKKTGETLEEELDLTHTTIKELARKAIRDHRMIKHCLYGVIGDR